MIDERRKNRQYELAFTDEPRGEAPATPGIRVEAVMAVNESESPAGTERLMEEICERDNLLEALERVKSNKGAPGVDGMTVNELPNYLRKNWPTIQAQLLSGSYVPKPVRRVEIPKPTGGFRMLGIPCVLDRFIQQAVLRVLQERWDPTFSEQSYGFRPGRSAHQAVSQAQQYIAEGHRYVVDFDLEKFFDRVNHDLLMGRVAKRISDKRLLRLIRSFLNAGIMDHGLFQPLQDEGVPQGGPLSPLLSNLFLDDLDRELERRGHRFVRYADDCNIYVRSERAGHRVMESIKQYLGRKLRLRINEKKSAVAPVDQRKFLGFGMALWKPSEPRRVISPESIVRFKQKVRRLTRRARGRSLDQVIEELSGYLSGWASYYGFSELPSVLRDLDSWIRHRLRCYVWSQWKTYKRRVEALVELGVERKEAVDFTWRSRRYGPWHMSLTKLLHKVFSNEFFREHGLFSLATK